MQALDASVGTEVSVAAAVAARGGIPVMAVLLTPQVRAVAVAVAATAIYAVDVVHLHGKAAVAAVA